MALENSFAYLARQPILDREGKIFAYELLFRDSPTSDTAVIQNNVLATAQVLENTLNNMGFSKILGGRKAFVNCSREMLLDQIFGLLDSKYFVLEILEDVEADETVLNMVRKYKARGFEFALDDIVFTPEKIKKQEAFFPYITYAKMDLVENSPEDRLKAVAFFKKKGIYLLAEKVETESEFNECMKEGFDFFQGFFFAKPELITERKVDTNTAAILHILQILRNEPTLSEVHQAFLENPEISHNFMKYVNSVPSSRRFPVYSLSEAISWIGIQSLNEWLILMLYARLEIGEEIRSSPLFQNASQRAKFLENLAEVIEPEGELPGKAFITGLVSRMDALVKAPLKSIVTELILDQEIALALLERKGVLGTLLNLADAVEKDNVEEIKKETSLLSLSSNDLSRSLNMAYAWGGP